MGGRIHTSPISYELDGRHVLNNAGGVMFAWTLPPTGTQEVTSTELAGPVQEKVIGVEVVVL
jgi:hypothetical protein